MGTTRAAAAAAAAAARAQPKVRRRGQPRTAPKSTARPKAKSTKKKAPVSNTNEEEASGVDNPPPPRKRGRPKKATADENEDDPQGENVPVPDESDKDEEDVPMPDASKSPGIDPDESDKDEEDVPMPDASKTAPWNARSHPFRLTPFNTRTPRNPRQACARRRQGLAPSNARTPATPDEPALEGDKASRPPTPERPPTPDEPALKDDKASRPPTPERPATPDEPALEGDKGAPVAPPVLEGGKDTSPPPPQDQITPPVLDKEAPVPTPLPPPPPPPHNTETPIPPPPPPKHAANPHAPPTEEDITLQGASWRLRNPDAPEQPPGKGKKKVDLSAAAKASLKLKRELGSDRKTEYMAAISDFEQLAADEAERIAKKFGKDIDAVKKTMRGLTSLAKERAINLQNAKVWKYSAEVNANLPPGSKIRAPALHKHVKTAPKWVSMTQSEQDLLLQEFEEARGVKKSGTRLSNAAASRDVTAFTNRMDKELTLLYKRTGAIGFCCIGRSDVGDTLKPACVGREAVKFFPHVLHTTDNQFAMKFDNYTCNRDLVGTEVNFNTLRSQTIGMIGDGLERATGKKIQMKYNDYDSLLTEYHVKLLGWPEEVEFLAPSVLGNVERLRPLYDALISGSCRWQKMSDARIAEHKAAMAEKTAAKKKKKERSDKGLTREEAAEERKRKREEEEEEGVKKRKSKLSALTPEERTEHERKLNREKKQRQRLRKKGLNVPAPSRKRKHDGSDDDDEDDSPPVPRKKRKASSSKKIVSPEYVESSDEEESSDDDAEYGRSGKKNKGKKKREKEDDEGVEEVPKRKKGKAKAKAVEESSGEDSGEESDHRLNLPFSAKPKKMYQVAQEFAKVTSRDRLAKKKAARRSPSKAAAQGWGGNVASSSNAASGSNVASTSQLPKSLAQLDREKTDESESETDADE
ncbi:hypothetical protein C8F04DRAFT_1259490 [Mycena alexandri]|uniref:Uncharacterized protein n=1 Tax=Mycena alexandri TaxID=1745969 RepID=A0AAD6SXC9_9AGAR|nr:hypothetical protein C8F04DRAFT_1259490 [Mycena alexandri]